MIDIPPRGCYVYSIGSLATGQSKDMHAWCRMPISPVCTLLGKAILVTS